MDAGGLRIVKPSERMRAPVTLLPFLNAVLIVKRPLPYVAFVVFLPIVVLVLGLTFVLCFASAEDRYLLSYGVYLVDFVVIAVLLAHSVIQLAGNLIVRRSYLAWLCLPVLLCYVLGLGAISDHM